MSGGDGNDNDWRPSDAYTNASGSRQWQTTRPSFSRYSPSGYADGNRQGSAHRYNSKRFNKPRNDDYRRDSNRYYDRSKNRSYHRRHSSSSDEDRSRSHNRHRRRRSSSVSSHNSDSKRRSKEGQKKSHSDKKNNSKSHSRRYSKSPESNKYNNKYSDESQNESDDIDGIALDEAPPSSWNAESNVITFSSNYSEYRQELPVAAAPFKNDGSFLEMFKKMQESQKKEQETEQKPEVKKPAVTLIGKRRGGRVLKTGVVKKVKSIDEEVAEEPPKNAWSIYMSEVKKYREAKCDEEVKTRPLVK